MFEILGVAGITISMLAYVPQVVHLSKEHCSAGISRRAWAMWLVASLLVGTLAVHRGDFVFIALQLSTLTAAAIILFLAQRYHGMVCETHAADPAHELTATGGPRRPIAAMAAKTLGHCAGVRAMKREVVCRSALPRSRVPGWTARNPDDSRPSSVKSRSPVGLDKERNLGLLHRRVIVRTTRSDFSHTSTEPAVDVL